jgi:hypothetical protein
MTYITQCESDMAAICGDVNTVSRRASPFKGARPLERAMDVAVSLRAKATRQQQAYPKDHYGKIEHVFACRWRARHALRHTLQEGDKR